MRYERLREIGKRFERLDCTASSLSRYAGCFLGRRGWAAWREVGVGDSVCTVGGLLAGDAVVLEEEEDAVAGIA